MRFGLDRMRRMMTVLGLPERRFDSIHVVGTNGKSSTTRMIAAILSVTVCHRRLPLPAPGSYTERIQVDEQRHPDDRPSPPPSPVRHGRPSASTEPWPRTITSPSSSCSPPPPIWELAQREVQVAVIEAGLGGRYDATSVIDSRVTVLTNVGLEHTRWLGPTLGDIASEKLAVVASDSDARPGRRSGPEVDRGRR